MLVASAKCRSSKTIPSSASDSASSAALDGVEEARPALAAGQRRRLAELGQQPGEGAPHRRLEAAQEAGGQGAQQARRGGVDDAAVAGPRADDEGAAAGPREVADQPALAHAALAADDGVAAGVPGLVQRAPRRLAADQPRRQQHARRQAVGRRRQRGHAGGADRRQQRQRFRRRRRRRPRPSASARSGRTRAAPRRGRPAGRAGGSRGGARLRRADRSAISSRACASASS